VHSIVGVIVLSSLAFVGTMSDNFLAFGAQLVVTDASRVARVCRAQALAVGTIVIMASALGSVFAPVPVRWLGVLCVAPFYFAWHAWQHRHEVREQFRRGAVTTFTVTLAIGGDNLAVWTPLFRSSGVAKSFLVVATFALWEVLFLVAVRRLAQHPRVVTWGTRVAPHVTPVVYFLLGILVLVECRSF